MSRTLQILLNTILVLSLTLNVALFISPKEPEVITVTIDKPIYITKTVEVSRRAASRGDRTEPVSEREMIDQYIVDICKQYGVDECLIQAIVWKESRYNADAISSDGVGSLGLMQITPRWHAERAKRLGVTNFTDPKGNILLGVDYIAELFSKYDDPALVLMLYNMKHESAFQLYNAGQISDYAQTVLDRAKRLRHGDIVDG